MSSPNLTEILKVLEKKIQQTRNRLTLTEAAAITGLPVDQVEVGLREMINLYDCRLQVTENGDLIYDFGSSLHRRGEKTFREIFNDILEWCWKAFTIVFKIWLSVTLVIYTIVFAILLLAWLFKGGDSDRDVDFGVGIGDIAYLFVAIFDWNTYTPAVYYETDRYGYQYQRYKPKPSLLKKDKKSFIASVYDFVFGPSRVVPDLVANHREAAAFIRQNNGLLVTTDLKALAGWTSSEAAVFFSECIARFQGDIKISENGIMYGDFQRLLRTVSDVDASEIVYYWNEYEPPYELTGNTTGMNVGVTCMNAFNLILSVVCLFIFAKISLGLVLFLGVIPFAFSILFFLIPLVRSIKVRSANEQRHHNNIRKRVMRVIFGVKGAPMSVEAITNAVNANRSREEVLSVQVIEAMLEQLRKEIPGDLTFSPTGQTLYTFPAIGMEVDEAQRLRAQQRVDSKLGAVVFDSVQEPELGTPRGTTPENLRQKKPGRIEDWQK